MRLLSRQRPKRRSRKSLRSWGLGGLKDQSSFGGWGDRMVQGSGGIQSGLSGHEKRLSGERVPVKLL